MSEALSGLGAADGGGDVAPSGAMSVDDFDSAMDAANAAPPTSRAATPPTAPLKGGKPDPLANLSEEEARAQLEALERGEETPEQVEEPGAEDESQAGVEDADREEFAKWREAKAAGKLADLLSDDDVVMMDGEEPVTFAELKRGNLRDADATKKWQEAGALRREAQTTLQNVDRLLKDCENVETLEARFEDLNLAHVLDQYAERRYEQFKNDFMQLRRLAKQGVSKEDIDSMRELMEQRRLNARQQRIESRRAARQREAVQRQQQAQQTQQQGVLTEQMANALKQLRAPTFKLVGLDPANPNHNQLFSEHLDAYLRFGNTKGMQFRDVVHSAARAAKQTYDGKIKVHRDAEIERVRQQAKLPPITTSAGGTAPAKRVVQQPRQQLSADHFDDYIGKLGGV